MTNYATMNSWNRMCAALRRPALPCACGEWWRCPSPPPPCCRCWRWGCTGSFPPLASAACQPPSGWPLSTHPWVIHKQTNKQQQRQSQLPPQSDMSVRPEACQEKHIFFFYQTGAFLVVIYVLKCFRSRTNNMMRNKKEKPSFSNIKGRFSENNLSVAYIKVF